MANDTAINLEVGATNATAGTFSDVSKSISQFAERTAAKMQLSIAKSVAFGQIFYGVTARVSRSAIAAAAELGTISDRAQQMQVSSEYAQKLSGALGQVGVKANDLDSLTTAFDKMTLATGKVGSEGFEEVLKGIAGIVDEQERVKQLSAVFGRAMGPGLAPLLRQGPDGFISGLHDIMDGMPAVSNAAVDAGDSMADGWAAATADMKASFQQMIGDVAMFFQDDIEVKPEEAIRKMVANFKWGLAVVWAHFQVLGENIGKWTEWLTRDWKATLDWIMNGISAWIKGSIANWLLYFDTLKSLGKEFGKAFVRWITGDEADWSGTMGKVMDKLDEAGKEFKKNWDSMAPKKPLGLELSKVDYDGLWAQREETMRTIEESIKAKEELAKNKNAAAAAVEEEGKKAANKISDAVKNAKWMSASSYEAFKLSMGSRNVFGTSGVQINPASSSSSASQSGTILAELKEILSLQRSGWKTIEKLAAV